MNIKAIPVNLEMFRGDSFDFTFTVRDRDTDDPIDITGFNVTFTARFKFTDPDTKIIAKKSVHTTGIVLTDAVHGVFKTSLLPADTLAVPLVETEVFYDCKLEGTDSSVKTCTYGTLTVKPTATTSP